MSQFKTAEDIRQRMAEVRVRGVADANELDRAIERVKDWREHFKVHPFASIALAAVAGYSLVPHRKAVPTTARCPSVASVASSGALPESSTAASSALRLVVGGLMSQILRNAAKTWVTSQIQKRFNNTSDGSEPKIPIGVR